MCHGLQFSAESLACPSTAAEWLPAPRPLCALTSWVWPAALQADVTIYAACEFAFLLKSAADLLGVPSLGSRCGGPYMAAGQVDASGNQPRNGLFGLHGQADALWSSYSSGQCTLPCL